MFPIRDTVPNRTFPSTTWMIIILCGIVFLFETSLPPELLEEFTYYFGVVPREYTGRHRHGLPLIDYLSLVTTMFLHGGWLHFLGNMWFLKIFGSKVEDRMGHCGFLGFYLVTGVLASISYIYFSPRSSMPVIGASGAIAGVMGAYYVLFPRAKILTLIPIFIFPWFIRLPAVFFLGWWFLIQLFSGTVAQVLPADDGGVAWWAHVGGFIFGILLMPLFRKASRAYY